MTFRRDRGMTLVETLVGVGLLGLLLVVVADAIMWGLRAQRKGEAARIAQAEAREALSKLVDEIGNAVALSTLTSSSNFPVDFFSGVVWPDDYQQRATEFTDPTYARTRTSPGGVDTDTVRNRVILTRPGVAVSNQNYNDQDYSQFVYVEYLVPPPNVNLQGQHMLLRRVYRVAPNSASTPQGNICDGTQYRYINTGFFSIPTYDASNPLAIFSNANTSDSALPADQKSASEVVLQLPADTDQINFTISHTRNRLDNLGNGYYAYYDPSVFTITMTLNVGRIQTTPLQFAATRTITGQALVKSGT